MAQYRKLKESDTWHFCSNCSNYPKRGYTTSSGKPTSGELCNQCQAKQSKNDCK